MKKPFEQYKTVAQVVYSYDQGTNVKRIDTVSVKCAILELVLYLIKKTNTHLFFLYKYCYYCSIGLSLTDYDNPDWPFNFYIKLHPWESIHAIITSH